MACPASFVSKWYAVSLASAAVVPGPRTASLVVYWLFYFTLQPGVSESRLPAVINNETPAANRKAVYGAGGVVFVTSRILVMDLLTHRVLPAAITGFVLLNAHTLTETGIEAFILRIYRRHTACGFVKAFSDDPITLASTFGRLERTLRTLMVRRVHLWPRFHLAVRKQLQKTEPEVAIGFSVPLGLRYS
jgi:DNA excision repair protein ERCC-4